MQWNAIKQTALHAMERENLRIYRLGCVASMQVINRWIPRFMHTFGLCDTYMYAARQCRPADYPDRRLMQFITGLPRSQRALNQSKIKCKWIMEMQCMANRKLPRSGRSRHPYIK
uniref:Uncharacterized protein orf114a n=1 Tax=Chlorokybus atmophyticus TaxID=3144 RepID=A6YE84_CHLAT|nr:hypothetical protein Chatpmp12 [Chlorokybus atmophyticus]ABO15135.1 hypothetical protein [Chlorokybus atmophyticus]